MPLRTVFAISLVLLNGTALAQHNHTGDAPSLMNTEAMGAGDRPEHEAFQIFDNLYYVGINFVSAYVLTTSDGLILIDATYDNTVDHLLKGMRQFDLDPADIKYILVTHWHADHFGGAERMHALCDAPVGMAGPDWDSKFLSHTLPSDKVRRIADGDTLTVGDTTLELFHTPGHTLGVTSIAFTVYDKGTPHRAFMFGGTGLNFSGLDQAEMFVASLERIGAMDGIEVNIPNHPSMGRVFERYETLTDRQPGDPHPFVDPEGFQQWIAELRASGERKRERERARAEKRRR